MEMLWSAIVGALSGGGLTSLVMLRTRVASGKIDNAKKIIEMYEDIADKYEKLACFRQACSDRINSKNEK